MMNQHVQKHVQLEGCIVWDDRENSTNPVREGKAFEDPCVED